MQYTPEEEEGLHQKLRLLLGSTIRTALKDVRTTEIVVNDDGVVRVERLGQGFEKTNERFTPAGVVSLLKTIATMQVARVTREFPILETDVPGFGARVEGVLPPITKAPNLTMRKHAPRVYTLAEYVENGRMTTEMLHALRRAVDEGLNILTVGGTGSGKTTLQNALLHEIEQREPGVRCGILEDTREILSQSEHHFQFTAQREINVDLERLVVTALRMRPDRIVVGEVRATRPAVELLKAWNTGHRGGLCTLHANGAEAGLRKLEHFVAPELGRMVARAEIADTVGLVVFTERSPSGPVLRTVQRVRGFGRKGYVLESLATHAADRVEERVAC